MSIVRMGMAEDSKFGEGYDAIFGKKPKKAKKPKKDEKKPEEAKKGSEKKK